MAESGADGAPMALGARDAAVLSALAAPIPTSGVAAAVRSRLAEHVPERIRVLAGADNVVVHAVMSLTSSGRQWREYLSRWSDGEIGRDVAGLEARGCIRRFRLESRPAERPSRGIGIICGRPGRALDRLMEELSSSAEWRGENVVIVSGETDADAIVSEPHAPRVIGRQERDAVIGKMARHDIESEIAGKALSGDAAGPNIGANRNLLTLASGYSTVVSVDDDVHARPYTWWGQPTATHAMGEGVDPREWTGGRTVAGLLRRVVPAGQTIPELLSKRLQTLFRDLVANHADMSWQDGFTRETWPERWWDARIRLAWTGVIGHTGMGLTRRVLQFEGASRKLVVSHRSTYEAATRLGIAAACAPCEVLLPPMFFAGGAFAYDQAAIVPPFPPSGRGEETVFGAVLGRVHPSALACAVPVMAWHEPVEERHHGRSCVDPRLRGNHVLSLVVAEAPVSAAEPALRMIEIGQYLEEIGSLPAPALAEALAWRACRQLEQTWAQLFRLRAKYDSPEWWLRDVEEMSARIREAVASHRPPGETCDRTLLEPLETVGRRIRDYGRILQVWPAMWSERSHECRALHARGRRRTNPREAI